MLRKSIWAQGADRPEKAELRIGEIVTVDLPRPHNRLTLADDPRYMRCRHALLEFLY